MKNSNDIELKRHYMRNNYFVTIDGKKIDLTDDQIKLLGLKRCKNPFKRVEDYYTIKGDGEIECYRDRRDRFDDAFYSESNYFNDKNFAKQVALHQLLYRKLLKFAYDNGYEDSEPWDDETMHYSIYYDSVDNSFDISPIIQMKYCEVYFSSEEGAEKAIEKVVKPFMKEHLDFVW